VTNGDERIRIESGGDVGIGTYDPKMKVHIESGTPYIRTRNSAAPSDEKTWDFNAGIDGIFRFRNTNDAGNSSNNWLEVERDGVDTHSIRLLTGTGSERLRITSNGEVRVPDGGKFSCGTGDDLMINHDGGNSFIDNFTGTFVLRNYADDSDILLSSDNSSGGTADYVRCDGSTGAVILSHYGSTKLETSSSGVTVTGTLNATTAVTQNGNALATNGKAIAMALIFG
jgi:hypothetical protein